MKNLNMLIDMHINNLEKAINETIDCKCPYVEWINLERIDHLNKCFYRCFFSDKLDAESTKQDLFDAFEKIKHKMPNVSIDASNVSEYHSGKYELLVEFSINV